MNWIDEVVRDVAELDYNSPVDQPSVMLVKESELRAILVSRAPEMHEGWTLNRAADDVMKERLRQIDVEGWTPEHDDEHGDGQMALAGAAYAVVGYTDATPSEAPAWWPWSAEWWKPRDKRRNLVKAAALLLAELERLDRHETPNDRGNRGPTA